MVGTKQSAVLSTPPTRHDGLRSDARKIMNRELIHSTPALPRGDPPYQRKPCDGTGVREMRASRDRALAAYARGSCPFRSTRAAINTTVSLIIAATEPAANAN